MPERGFSKMYLQARIIAGSGALLIACWWFGGVLSRENQAWEKKWTLLPLVLWTDLDCVAWLGHRMGMIWTDWKWSGVSFQLSNDGFGGTVAGGFGINGDQIIILILVLTWWRWRWVIWGLLAASGLEGYTVPGFGRWRLYVNEEMIVLGQA